MINPYLANAVQETYVYFMAFYIYKPSRSATVVALGPQLLHCGRHTNTREKKKIVFRAANK
jgi:hypothetical protein